MLEASIWPSEEIFDGRVFTDQNSLEISDGHRPPHLWPIIAATPSGITNQQNF